MADAVMVDEAGRRLRPRSQAGLLDLEK